uniref:Uncharacterized protein n=1 Tax=Sphaerodactylus townsendi TaxID=933632 RepID=A0ACB8EI67_9SAUR
MISSSSKEINCVQMKLRFLSMNCLLMWHSFPGELEQNTVRHPFPCTLLLKLPLIPFAAWLIYVVRGTGNVVRGTEMFSLLTHGNVVHSMGENSVCSYRSQNWF